MKKECTPENHIFEENAVLCNCGETVDRMEETIHWLSEKLY